MFQHFGQRLKRDLKQLVEQRLDASVTASGSVLKVFNHPFTRNRLDTDASASVVVRRGSRCYLSQTAKIRRLVRWFSPRLTCMYSSSLISFHDMLIARILQ